MNSEILLDCVIEKVTPNLSPETAMVSDIVVRHIHHSDFSKVDQTNMIAKL